MRARRLGAKSPPHVDPRNPQGAPPAEQIGADRAWLPFALFLGLLEAAEIAALRHVPDVRSAHKPLASRGNASVVTPGSTRPDLILIVLDTVRAEPTLGVRLNPDGHVKRESRDFVTGLCRDFILMHVATPPEKCERDDVKGLICEAPGAGSRTSRRSTIL